MLLNLDIIYNHQARTRKLSKKYSKPKENTDIPKGFRPLRPELDQVTGIHAEAFPRQREMVSLRNS